MKVRSLLVAFLLLASTAQAGEQSTTDRVVEQAQDMFERTISIIASPFPFMSEREIQCLARNIFYESASEPTEGKVAVGLVTLNRTADPRFPNDVCGVVKQKTILTKTKTVVKETATIFGPKKVQETKTVATPVCQFSWNCHAVKKPKEDDPRWIQSQEIARELADGGFEQYRVKYADAKHFHAVYVKPGWKNKRIARVGNHIFYE
jgi:spore germination cell wall hydrolase CwlJ-like protein